jgi:hypothetical protein
VRGLLLVVISACSSTASAPDGGVTPDGGSMPMTGSPRTDQAQ